uniref:Uncharacterized protein LOC104231109 n=1 Tax=Nicotiana sylvestris TaxID=4096 RepID=A0A1U7X636_NICSY
MQFPVYYVSRTLGDSETRYPHLEKLSLTLTSASRKLKPYFKCHRICVLSSYPLWSVLHKFELLRRLAKWDIDLGGYNIEYQPWEAIKSQILVDFVADFSPTLVPEVEKELLLKPGKSSGVWTLFTDGATNARGSKLGIVLKPPVGSIIRQSLKTTKITNNEAEYEAMIASLELAKSLRAETVEEICDSFLVVSQVNGSYEVREDMMKRYLDKIQIALRHFKEWTLDHVPHEKNSESDALEKLGSSVEEEDLLPRTIVHLFKYAVVEGHVEINSTSLTWDWKNKYIDYLKDGKLPTDPKESRPLRTKAICLGLGNTDYVLREINECTCGNHSMADSLVRKVIRAGYYWDGMEKDAREFVRKCDKCQRFAPMIHHPGEQLHSVLSPWPFVKWGMDIIGPLLIVPGKTTPKLSTGETPFFLVNGVKALIPAEVGEPSARFRHSNKGSNNEARATALELLDERREASLVQMAAQKQKIERYYNRRTNLRYFRIGELVLRK